MSERLPQLTLTLGDDPFDESHTVDTWRCSECKWTLRFTAGVASEAGSRAYDHLTKHRHTWGLPAAKYVPTEDEKL